MTETEAYISAFPADTRQRLNAIRDLIRKLAPQATERMCMGIPTYDLNGKWLVHFAGFKKHIGFYPQPDGVEAFREKLEGYKTSKGTIQFPLNQPLPLDLIAEIIKFKVGNQTKQKPRSS